MKKIVLVSVLAFMFGLFSIYGSEKNVMKRSHAEVEAEMKQIRP